MFNLTNISVKKFFLLQDEELYRKYMRFSNEEDPFYIRPREIVCFAGKESTPLGELSFGEVSDIRHNLSNPSFNSIYECFRAVFGVGLKKYLAQDVVSYITAMNWIKANTIKLADRERKSLGGDPDPLMEMAGVHRLIAFRELNTLKILAQQFHKSPEEIENWKYNLVFSLMLHDKVSNEVQSAYNELKYGNKSKA